jgi:hypothetical protein
MAQQCPSSPGNFFIVIRPALVWQEFRVVTLPLPLDDYTFILFSRKKEHVPSAVHQLYSGIFFQRKLI